jgi:hypothetical protein
VNSSQPPNLHCLHESSNFALPSEFISLDIIDIPNQTIMKIAISLLVVIISLFTLQSAVAQQQTITYDSLALDSIQAPQIVENASSVLGFANNSNVALNNTSYFVLGQFYHGSSTPIEFQVGSKIEFYWTRASNDSSHAWFVLRHYIVNANGWINPDGPGDTAFVTQSMTTLPQKYTFTVPNAGYNTVEVWPDGTPGAKPAYLDAIVLVQHGTITTNSSSVDTPLAQAAGFACYPNPFVSTQGTMLQSLNDERGTYIVMDLLGNEVQHFDASPNARVTVPAAGTYFIRKRVGNAWVGAPLRISAQ